MSKARELAQKPNQPTGRKNLIINGAMRIDQRNSGGSIALSGSVVYDTDRFLTRLGTSTSSTAQQVSDAPDGFNYSLKLTIGTGASPSAAAGDGYFGQVIEGYNSAHLNWGTSSAKTVTFSFWVKSSLTGTFGLVVANYALNASYPTSYTINSVNTWEHKTITISGPTSGGFNTTNSGGLYILFDWGCGSDYKGTANSWAASDYRGGATGTQSICATSGATWQVTGVQLEVGTVATEFEHPNYGEELQLCQRYYQKSFPYSTVAGTATDAGWVGSALRQSDQQAGYLEGDPRFQQRMRASPTITFYDKAGTAGKTNYYIGASTIANYTMTVHNIFDTGFSFYSDDTTTKGGIRFAYTADAEL